MNNLKVKLITGFREDQHYTIDADEAHKAYYLFLHTEERGVFSNGVAIIGKNIQSIEPDYNATMGWHSTHELDSDDFAEIRSKGIDRKLRDVLYQAKEVAMIGNPEMLKLPLPLSLPESKSNEL
jgi:hypothetical protein